MVGVELKNGLHVRQFLTGRFHDTTHLIAHFVLGQHHASRGIGETMSDFHLLNTVA